MSRYLRKIPFDLLVSDMREISERLTRWVPNRGIAGPKAFASVVRVDGAYVLLDGAPITESVLLEIYRVASQPHFFGMRYSVSKSAVVDALKLLASEAPLAP